MLIIEVTGNRLRKLPVIRHGGLTELLARGNEIDQLSTMTSADVPQLNYIDLRENRISALLDEMIPDTVKDLKLAGNPVKAVSPAALRKLPFPIGGGDDFLGKADGIDRSYSHCKQDRTGHWGCCCANGFIGTDSSGSLTTGCDGGTERHYSSNGCISKDAFDLCRRALNSERTKAWGGIDAMDAVLLQCDLLPLDRAQTVVAAATGACCTVNIRGMRSRGYDIFTSNWRCCVGAPGSTSPDLTGSIIYGVQSSTAVSGTSTFANSGTSPANIGAGSSDGAVGIIVGIVVFLAAVCVAMMLIVRQRRKARNEAKLASLESTFAAEIASMARQKFLSSFVHVLPGSADDKIAKADSQFEALSLAASRITKRGLQGEGDYSCGWMRVWGSYVVYHPFCWC